MTENAASAEIESAVIGAMLGYPDAVPLVLGVLQPEHFFDAKFRKIYAAIQAVAQRDEPVDLQTARAELEATGNLEKIGGISTLLDCADPILTGANAEQHARIVLRKAINRQLAALGKKIAGQCENGAGDTNTLIDSFQSELSRISLDSDAGDSATCSWRDLAPEVSMRIDETQTIRQERGIVGLARSGLPDLDRRIGGFRPGQLIVVGGRASMGKTALAVSMIIHMAQRERVPVAVFSLEMNRLDIGTRLLCADAGVCVARALNGELDADDLARISEAQARMFDMTLFVDKSESLTLPTFTARSARFAKDYGVKIIILDYLQLMTGPARAQNREQEVAAITRTAKKIAMTHDIAVIALSQLSRAAEQRTGKDVDRLPTLTDLRESGAIEQDADIVLFPWRKMVFDDWGMEIRKPEPQEAKIKVAKNRNGPLGIVPAYFMPEPMMFVGRAYDTEPWGI